MNGDEIPLKLNIEGGVSMDLTEKYILMNKKADEIQRLLHAAVRLYGTPSWYNNVLIRILAGEVFYFADFNEEKKETVWLPTQEQLQRVVRVSNPEFLARDFLDFIYDQKLGKKKEIVVGINTMEQLWLAFVMYSNHKKVWNNKQKQWIDSKQ